MIEGDTILHIFVVGRVADLRSERARRGPGRHHDKTCPNRLGGSSANSDNGDCLVQHAGRLVLEGRIACGLIVLALPPLAPEHRGTTYHGESFSGVPRLLLARGGTVFKNTTPFDRATLAAARRIGRRSGPGADLRMAGRESHAGLAGRCSSIGLIGGDSGRDRMSVSYCTAAPRLCINCVRFAACPVVSAAVPGQESPSSLAVPSQQDEVLRLPSRVRRRRGPGGTVPRAGSGKPAATTAGRETD
ncbi:hypothetical protein TCAP_05108 [Tolypocladium capitatum]|uniref:Uncharacterized protein n=1 Tax=Tolypocladium capitatum TaxID=45235 RepID=A0A2K3QBN6_9HYPO|nr:hypothetical protein TCAP_05108 [Tolypocladium capitatum]